MEEETKCDSIVLRDSKGKVRILLEASDQFPRIQLFGDNRSEISLCIDGDRPRIVLSRQVGKPSLTLVVTEEHTAGVIYDEIGRPAIKVARSVEGVNKVTVFKNGQIAHEIEISDTPE